MSLAIMQPYLFPYIGYWQLINAVDTFVIYDDVNFIKQGYINKNTILINHKANNFTLEVKGASSNKLINQIGIGHNKQKILKTIKMAYRKAPYFNTSFPIIKQILESEEQNLAKFIGNSLIVLSNYLCIETEFIYSSTINKDNSLKAQDKILHMTKLLNVENYINAIGGKELYDKNIFHQEGVNLSFLDTEVVEYKQFKNDFTPYLSIIDVMMFNNLDEIKLLLNRYKLV